MTDLYRDNKRLIKSYVIMALIFSCLMCLTTISFADGEGDVAIGFGGTFGSTFEQAAEFAFGTSISPSYVLGLGSALSLLREAGADFLPNLSFGLCDIWAVRILSFLWVALSMLTPVLGEEMEKINTKYVGPIMIFLFEFIALTGLGKGGGTVEAATIGISHSGADVATGIFIGVVEFFKIILMLAVYFFVRYFNYAISALIALISGLDSTVSAVFRILRGLIATGFLLLAEYCPWVFYIFYAILIIVSVLVFRWANRIITYFKAIYIEPIKRAVFFSKREVPLVSKRRPKRLADSELAIPVFSLRRRIVKFPVKVRSKWWLAKDSEGAYIFRPAFLKRPEEIIRLEDVYIREAGPFKHGFFEISELDRKAVRLVFSREYKPVLDKILELTGYGDYRIIEAQKKEEKRLAREQKQEEKRQIREQKKEEHRAQREEMKEKFRVFFTGPADDEEFDDLI